MKTRHFDSDSFPPGSSMALYCFQDSATHEGKEQD
jgi:hypothetical protein